MRYSKLGLFLLLFIFTGSFSYSDPEQSPYALARVNPDTTIRIEVGDEAFILLDSGTLFLATPGDEHSDIILYSDHRPFAEGRIKSSEIQFFSRLGDPVQQAYFSDCFRDFMIMSEQKRKALRLDSPRFPDDPEIPKTDSTQKAYIQRHATFESFYIHRLLQEFPRYFENTGDENLLNAICELIYLNRESVKDSYPLVLGACFESSPRLVNCAMSDQIYQYGDLDEKLMTYLHLQYPDKNNPDSLNARGKLLEASIEPMHVLEVVAGLGDTVYIDGELVPLNQVHIRLKKFLLSPHEIGCSREVKTRDGKMLPIPNSAVLLYSVRGTYYSHYIRVQNELKWGYGDARDELCRKLYGVSLSTIEKDREANADKIKNLKELIPQRIYEAM